MTRWNDDKRGSQQVAMEAAIFDSDTAILSVEVLDGKASRERLADTEGKPQWTMKKNTIAQSEEGYLLEKVGMSAALCAKPRKF